MEDAAMDNGSNGSNGSNNSGSSGGNNSGSSGNSSSSGARRFAALDHNETLDEARLRRDLAAGKDVEGEGGK